MQGLLGVEVLLVVVCLMLYILSAEYLEKHKIEYINESSLAILLGLLIGVLVILFGGKDYQFSSSVVFYFLLPPIIFAAGYTLKTKNFFMNFGFISLYGMLGTIFTFVSIGLLAVFFTSSGSVSLTSKECLLLASVLSATDTVAAITVVKESKFPKLHGVLFGEGVLNDAVSIVLFRTVESIGDTFGFWDSIRMVFVFLITTLLSVGAGLSTGLLAAWVFKKNQSLQQHPEREIGIIILVGYLSYILSELLGLSGIMAIFCCAVTMAHYTGQNTSKTAQQATGIIFTVMSQGAEAFTFTYLGMNLTTFKWEDWNIGFTLYMVLVIGLARFIGIYFTSLCTYLLRGRKFGLNTRSIAVIWYTGLIRGTIAVALALQIHSSNSFVLVTTTLTIALTTTLIFSNLISSFTRYIKLESNNSQEYFDLMPNNEEPSENCCFKLWKKIDKQYLDPWFGKEVRQNENSWEKVWEEDEIEISDLQTK